MKKIVNLKREDVFEKLETNDVYIFYIDKETACNIEKLTLYSIKKHINDSDNECLFFIIEDEPTTGETVTMEFICTDLTNKVIDKILNEAE